jgi:hypothetical protein
MQIQDLKTGPNQVPIVNPGLYAIVVKVMDRKIGNGNYGEWSLQTLELKDNTGTIQATIWGKPDLSALLGKEIHLSALNDGKGWAGCSIEDREYNAKDGSRKKTRQIKASGQFLLEECQPTAQPVAPGQPGYPNGNGQPAANPSEQPAAAPQAQPQRVSMTNWTEYMGIVRAAHYLANELEPDNIDAALATIDRARARSAIVNTILIAWGKKDFVFEAPVDDGKPPFFWL